MPHLRQAHLSQKEIERQLNLVFQKNDYKAALAAAAHPHFDIKKVDNPNCPYSVYRLLREEKYRTIEAFIDLGANPEVVDDYQISLLSSACIKRSAALVEKILLRGVDPNNQHQAKGGHLKLTPLHYVFHNYNNSSYDFVWHLLSLNPYPSLNTIKAATLEVVKTLFKYQANPNIPDTEGNTPLFTYIDTLRNNTEEVEPEALFSLFIANGVDLTQKNKAGLTIEEEVRKMLDKYPNPALSRALDALLIAKERRELQRLLKHTRPPAASTVRKI